MKSSLLGRLLWLTLLALPSLSTLAHAELQNGMNTLIVGFESQMQNDTSFKEKPSFWVNPGETLTLIPDQVLVENPNDESQSKGQDTPVRDFIWSSKAENASEVLTCDPQSDCGTSGFVPTEKGALFVVPLDMPKYIILTVKDRNDGTYNQITIWNFKLRTNPAAAAPTGAVQDPSETPTDQSFDYDNTLAPYGSSVNVDGETGWAPYTDEEDWQPYTHGQWNWNDSYGMVWMGEEPWAPYVYPYGYWRNTYQYGWVWFRVPGHTWRPHYVSWFYGASGVGWYPYAEGVTYRYSSWYRDGFWLGFGVGLAANPWRWGWSYVGYHEFIGVGIYDRWRGYRGWGGIYETYGYAYRNNYYGVHLGEPGSRGFIEGRFGEAHVSPNLAHTNMRFETRTGADGGKMFFARPTASTEYGRTMHAQAVSRLQSGTRPAAGAIVRANGEVLNRSATAGGSRMPSSGATSGSSRYTMPSGGAGGVSRGSYSNGGSGTTGASSRYTMPSRSTTTSPGTYGGGTRSGGSSGYTGTGGYRGTGGYTGTGGYRGTGGYSGTGGYRGGTYPSTGGGYHPPVMTTPNSGRRPTYTGGGTTPTYRGGGFGGGGFRGGGGMRGGGGRR